MAATIRDVAERAGVSIKTVSRVLNDEPFVRAEMRAKVTAAVAELGFVTNLSAKRLAKGQALTVGLLFHDASWHYIQNVQRGVLDTARADGYSTLMHPCDSARAEDVREIVTLASQRQVDGFVFMPPADNARTLLHSLAEMNVPFVRLGPSDRESAWPYVTATDRIGACEMTQHLTGLGHRRIGYVHGPREQRAGHDRYRGFLDGLALAGVEFDETLLRYGDDHFRAGALAGRSLLEMEPQPTATFCNNDEMAAGVCVAAHERGLRIPEDLSVAGFDDIPLAEQIWPPLTTVCQPIYQMASTATRLLIDILNRNPVTELQLEIPTHLVVRQSVGPALQAEIPASKDRRFTP